MDQERYPFRDGQGNNFQGPPQNVWNSQPVNVDLENAPAQNQENGVLPGFGALLRVATEGERRREQLHQQGRNLGHGNLRPMNVSHVSPHPSASMGNTSALYNLGGPVNQGSDHVGHFDGERLRVDTRILPHQQYPNIRAHHAPPYYSIATPKYLYGNPHQGNFIPPANLMVPTTSPVPNPEISATTFQVPQASSSTSVTNLAQSLPLQGLGTAAIHQEYQDALGQRQGNFHRQEQFEIVAANENDRRVRESPGDNARRVNEGNVDEAGQSQTRGGFPGQSSAYQPQTTNRTSQSEPGSASGQATATSSGSLSNSFGCPRCTKRFNTEEACKNHFMRAHKNRGCNNCPAQFETPYSLNMHVRTVHEGKKEEKCLFPGCDKVYGQPSHRNRHMRNDHDTEEAERLIKAEKEDLRRRRASL